MTVVFAPKRIALARESRGLTQAQLAEKLGVSSQQVSQWERGDVKPSAENVAKIMTALQSPSTFFFVRSGADGSQDMNQNEDGGES